MYGIMQVTLTDVVELATFAIRTFQISRVNTVVDVKKRQEIAL